MGDRIVVMDRGRVQQIGTPRVVFDRPANRFVAGFVGEPSMNFADAVLDGSGARPLLRFGRQCLAPEPAWLDAAGLKPERGLVVGIRPQHLRLAPPAPAGTPDRLCGTVYAAETLGSETIVDVEADGTLFRAWIQNHEIGGASLDIGAPVSLQADACAIYLFDRASGRTLAQADLSRLHREAADAPAALPT